MDFVFSTTEGQLVLRNSDFGLPDTTAITPVGADVWLLNTRTKVIKTQKWEQRVLLASGNYARTIFTVIIFKNFFFVTHYLCDTLFEFTGARKVLLNKVRENPKTGQFDYGIVVLDKEGNLFYDREVVMTGVADIACFDSTDCDSNSTIFALTLTGKVYQLAKLYHKVEDENYKVTSALIWTDPTDQAVAMASFDCYLFLLTTDGLVWGMTSKFGADHKSTNQQLLQPIFNGGRTATVVPGVFNVLNLPPIKRISASQDSIVALANDGMVYSWRAKSLLDGDQVTTRKIALHCDDVLMFLSNLYFVNREGLFVLGEADKPVLLLSYDKVDTRVRLH